MTIKLEDAEIEVLRLAVKAALDRADDPQIGKTFTGPRHNEVGFETRDGGIVVLKLRDYL